MRPAHCTARSRVWLLRVANIFFTCRFRVCHLRVTYASLRAVGRDTAVTTMIFMIGHDSEVSSCSCCARNFRAVLSHTGHACSRHQLFFHMQRYRSGP